MIELRARHGHEAQSVERDATPSGVNRIARLVQNSIEAHRQNSLIWPIWLAVSETRHLLPNFR